MNRRTLIGLLTAGTLAWAVIALFPKLSRAQEASADNPQPAELDLPAPKLTGSAKNWRNTSGKRYTIKPGKVTIVHFFTFG